MPDRGGRFSLDDYVDVAERIVHFKEQYPEGSLQTLSWTVEQVDGQSFVVYHAAAYRTSDDERPGLGIAWEPFPGTTPYTRNSELMNAETAAWGRAIVALGIVASRKLASKQEVQARQGERDVRQPSVSAVGIPPGEQPTEVGPPSAVNLIDEASLAALRRAFAETGWDEKELGLQLSSLGIRDVSNLGAAMAGLTQVQAVQLLSAMNAAIDLQVANA